MEEVTKQKESTVQEVLKRIWDASLPTLQPSTWEEDNGFMEYLKVVRSLLIGSVGLEEEIGTSQVTNVGKNLVNSTR